MLQKINISNASVQMCDAFALMPGYRSIFYFTGDLWVCLTCVWLLWFVCAVVVVGRVYIPCIDTHVE